MSLSESLSKSLSESSSESSKSKEKVLRRADSGLGVGLGFTGAKLACLLGGAYFFAAELPLEVGAMGFVAEVGFEDETFAVVFAD